MDHRKGAVRSGEADDLRIAESVSGRWAYPGLLISEAGHQGCRGREFVIDPAPDARWLGEHEETSMQQGWSITTSVARRAIQLGVVTGLRSQLPLALVAGAVQSSPAAVPLPGPFNWLNSRPLLDVARLSAAGEMVVDKLPVVPSRLAPGPLIFRLVVAGFAAGGLAVVARQPPVPAVILGIAGGAAGSIAGNRARGYLSSRAGLPDQIGAILEDLVAVGLGLNAVGGINPGTSRQVDQGR